jgi:hypothetical protein
MSVQTRRMKLFPYFIDGLPRRTHDHYGVLCLCRSQEDFPCLGMNKHVSRSQLLLDS